ncbi:MAG: hypothetical protein ACI4DP_12300 [Candidatus Ornithomonoglobus sp.]
MRERTHNSASTHSVGGRLLAFLLVFSMLFGVCPAALAEVTSTTIKVYNSTSNTPVCQDTGSADDVTIGSVSTGEAMTIQLTYGAADGDQSVTKNYTAKLYLGDMAYETLTYFSGGGKVEGIERTVDGVTYTVCKDADTGEYYLDITGISMVSGGTLSVPISAYFVNAAPNGTAWNLKLELYEEGSETATVSREVTVTASAEASMKNTKSAVTGSVTLSTVNDEEKISDDLSFKITAYSGTSLDTSLSSLNNGEAAIETYTVSDTLTLPNGMYFDVSATEDEAIKAALSDMFTSSSGTVTVTDYTTSDGKINSVTLAHTETSANTAKQIQDYVSMITLKGGSVVVAEGTGTSVITNEVRTAFTTVGGEPQYTDAATASVQVIRPTEAGYSDMSKTVEDAADLYGTYNPWGGYVMAGDYVLYKVSFKNNGDVAMVNASFTDTLPEGLEPVTEAELAAINSTNKSYFSNWDNQTKEWTSAVWSDSGSYTYDEGSRTYTFSGITITAGATFNAHILVKVSELGDGEVSRTLTNQAVIDGVTVSASVNQKAPAPEIKISKWVVKTDSNGNDSGSISAYADNDTIKYYITVSNTGSAAAEGITLEDIFPSGQVTADTDKITVTTEGGATVGLAPETNEATTSTLSWDNITIPAGGKVTIAIPGTVIAGTVESGASIVNTASETYNGETKTATSTLVSQSEAEETNPAATVSISKVITNGVTYVQEGDTVSYRITVVSPNATFDENNPLVVYDSLPDWLDIQINTVTASNNTGWAASTVSTEVTGNSVKFSMTVPSANTWNKYYVDFDCKVNENINNYPDGTVFNNTAEIDGGASAQADKITTGEEPATSTTSSTGLKAEKTAYVVRNGEKVYLTKDSVINDGEEINFEIKVTNVGEEAVTEFKVYDDLHGVYGKNNGNFYVYPYNSKGELLPIKDRYENSAQSIQIAIWDSNIFTGGNTVQYIDASGPFEVLFTDQAYSTGTWPSGSDIDYWGANTCYYPDFSLAAGDYIVLKYSLTPYSTFSSGSNGAKVDDGGYSTVSYRELSTLSISKTSVQSRYVAASESDLEALKIDYNIDITNESSVEYTSEGIYFVDELPAGAKLYGKGSVTVNGNELSEANFYIGNEYQNRDWTLVTETDSAPSGKYLGVFLGDSLVIQADNKLVLNYSIVLDPTSDEYAELIAEFEADGAFEPRQLINNVYFHGDTSFLYKKSANVSVEANDMTTNNTVELTSSLVHPGIDKEAYAYTAAEAQNVTIGKDRALPGAYLIWKIKVQNGGTSDDATMNSYTVVDTLPAGYVYRDGNSFSNASGASYPGGLSDSNLATGKIIKNNTTQLAYIEPTISGQTLTWDFSGEYALAPGEYLEYTIITYPEDEENVTSGIYYNSARVEVESKVYAETVSAGKYTGTGASDGDSFALNYVATTGEKTATEPDSDGNVTYTLKVTNNGSGEQMLENLTLIDRLPYVGDTAVLTEDERGSTAEAQLLGEPTVKLGDTTLTKDTDYTLGYSGVTGIVFNEHDKDWDGENGQLLWSPGYASSTKLIRIALADGVKVSPNETLTVTFTVKLTAEDITVDSVAYNSFGYCYNFGSNTDMAGESIKTESRLEAEVPTTGSIRIKKVCANNTLGVATAQTFYFAIFTSAYTEGAEPEQIQSITLMVPASGNPVNAEVTFENLYYPQTVGSRQTYYIYETDANGVPIKQSEYTDYTMYRGFYRIDVEDCEIVPVGEIAAGNDYCYWTKDLAPNKITNSAIFSNLNLIKEAEYNIVGPFYADVPFDSEGAAGDELTSTRTDEYGDKADDQASSVRGTDANPYANDDSGTLYAGAYNGFGGITHGHTIATGFFASFTPGDDSITSLTWNITTKATAENPVYVRAANGSTALGSMEFDGDAVYTDGSDETGYSIFKVKEGTEKTLRITDSLPTISGDGTANVGIIIDQLYDRNATATLTFNDPATANIGSGNVGDVTAAGTAVNQSQQIKGLTSINYEIALNNSDYYESSVQDAPLLTTTVEELKQNGITLSSGTLFHDSTHGTEWLYTIDINAPGAVKITLGDCQYSNSGNGITAKLLDSNGNVIDSVAMGTACYNATTGENTAVLTYNGSEAQELQVKFLKAGDESEAWIYLPYLKVESITPAATETPTTAPTEIPTETPTEEPTAEPTPDPTLKPITAGIHTFSASSFANSSITSNELSDDGYFELMTDSESNAITIASVSHTLAAADEEGKATDTVLGTFDTCIKLGGSGSVSNGKRLMAIKVSEGQTIEVYARSASTGNDRTLIIADEQGNQLTAGTAWGTEQDTDTKNYPAGVIPYTVTAEEAGTIYIYSSNSGINIYAVNVTDPAASE